MLQRDTFVASEADRWFDRNATALATRGVEEDLPLRLLELYRIRPRRVLEIGAANGWRLAALSARFSPERCVAVEPSAHAIAAGRATFPAVEFHAGHASATGLDQSFDLVIVHYVLHWLDRGELLSAVAEVDRRVSDGGYLLIGDFCPAIPTRVPYHHRPDLELYTWKQRYADIWLASGIYRPVGTLTNHHADGLDPAPAERDRGAVWLLQKDLAGLYARPEQR